MKVAFLLGSPSISGGTYVIFQHALKCLDMGCDVTIITEHDVTKEKIKWHNGAERLTFKKYQEVLEEEFDIIIATWYRTVYSFPFLKAKSYLYFVQSIESNFHPEANLKWQANATYTLPLNIITEATWIQKYLKDNYGHEAVLVKNGIRKDIYTKDGDVYPKEKGQFRVLVEGPVDIFYKNIPRTVELVRKSKADEIWLLTSSDINEYPGVDCVFSKQSLEECAKIYRSCDVLVKLSYVEGMFGPPLEIFHCGNTAITYDVSGYDEYLKDGYNSLIVKTGDEEGVVKAINKLYDDRKLLEKLKSNALKTAKKWPDWEQSSSEFYQAILNYKDKTNNYPWLSKTISYLWDTYNMLEDAAKKAPSKKEKLKEKFPYFYKIYRRIRYGKEMK